MPNLQKRLTYTPKAAFELFTEPVFSKDILPSGAFKGEMAEMTLMDDVSSKRTMVNIKGTANILQRRDAGCTITFNPLGKASSQYIETDELYGATKVCDNELYHGILEDFRNEAPRIREFIGEMFRDAIKQDVLTNSYFGNIKRAGDASGVYSWNKFNGVFEHAKGYIANGTMDSGQAVSIAAGAITPTDAYNQVKAIMALADGDLYMGSLPDNRKAVYVSKSIYNPIKEYIRNVGITAGEVKYITQGVELVTIDGVEIIEMLSWNPILNSIVGNTAHAVVYTIKGNMVFATDKEYGEYTPLGKLAFMFWYDWDNLTWKQAQFLRAGTGIAYPEHFYYGLTPYSV